MTDSNPVETVKQPKIGKLINLMVVAALVIVSLGVAIFLKWSFQNENIITVKNEPFPTQVLPDASHDTGGILLVTVDYCKNQEVEGDLRVSYVSKSTEYFTPITKERGEKGCRKVELPTVIPKELPQDTYKLRFRIVYDLNPIKKDIVSEFYSDEFKVGAQ